MGVQVEPLIPVAPKGDTEQKHPNKTTPGKKKIEYVQEFKEELKRVTWTSKGELVLCTKVVVGSTFVLGVGIYLADLAIKGFMNGFAGIVHWIFG